MKENKTKNHSLFIKKAKSEILTVILLALACGMAGCGHFGQAQQLELPVIEPIQQEQIQEPAQQEPEPENAALPLGDSSASSSSYFGTWQITSAIPSSYSAMPEEESSAMIGTHFEYFEDHAVYDSQLRLESPKYLEDTQTADDFSMTYKGSSLEMLGISTDSVQVVSIENASGIGGTFYIKDENTLITIWDGVFFEMQRADSGILPTAANPFQQNYDEKNEKYHAARSCWSIHAPAAFSLFEILAIFSLINSR